MEACRAKGIKPLLLALWKGHEEIAIFLFNKMSNPDCRRHRVYTFTHSLPSSVAQICQYVPRVWRICKYQAIEWQHTSALALKMNSSDQPSQNTRECTLQLIILLLEFCANRTTNACHLGPQHTNPQVRDMFQDHLSFSPRRLSFVSVGRRCVVEASSRDNCSFSPLPAGLCCSSIRHAGDFSEEQDRVIAT